MSATELHARGNGDHDTVWLSEEETKTFENIAESYQSVTGAERIETVSEAEENMTRRQRVGVAIGVFAAHRAAEVMNFADAAKEKVSDTVGMGVAYATIDGMSAMDKASRVREKLSRKKEKLASKEDDTRSTKVRKWLGRGAIGLAAGVATVGAAYLSHKSGVLPESLLDNIMPANRTNVLDAYVPGTGSAPAQNLVDGNKVTLGYEASAGPFIGRSPYEQSVAQGVTRLLDVIEGAGEGQKTIGGYSQGADVVREAASKLSEDEQRQLILNLAGDPSGEKGVLTLAHDSWQGRLMNTLGFDTSPLKDTGAATVNEIRVSNDIMADATFTIADAEAFNTAVERQDYVTVLRMLATTGEKGLGYATNHAGIIDVQPGDRVFHDVHNPGNATVTSEYRHNGVTHVITPNITALEQTMKAHLGFEMTPEARNFYTTLINPEATNEATIRAGGSALNEAVNNTPWIHADHKPIANQVISGVQEALAAHHSPAPAPVSAEAFVAPAQPAQEYVPAEPVYVAPAPVAPAYVAPVEVQHFVEQAAPVVEQIQQAIPQVNVNQIATDLKYIAPQFSADIDAVHGMLQPQQ